MSEDVLRLLLVRWLDRWEEIEEFVSDKLYLETEELAQFTRDELSFEDIDAEIDYKKVVCPACGSESITELDSLKVDHCCVEWECDDCGHTWGEINYEKLL